MKTTELTERSASDLVLLESELARDLWKTRFSNYTNQLDYTAKIRRLRRQIARVKTVLTQKEAPAAEAKAPKAAPVAKPEKAAKAPKAKAEAKAPKAAAKPKKAKG